MMRQTSGTIALIPDEELLAVREALRSYLIAFIRERARQLWTQKQVTAARVVAAGTLLDPAALTIDSPGGLPTTSARS